MDDDNHDENEARGDEVWIGGVRGELVNAASEEIVVDNEKIEEHEEEDGGESDKEDDMENEESEDEKEEEETKEQRKDILEFKTDSKFIDSGGRYNIQPG